MRDGEAAQRAPPQRVLADLHHAGDEQVVFVISGAKSDWGREGGAAPLELHEALLSLHREGVVQGRPLLGIAAAVPLLFLVDQDLPPYGAAHAPQSVAVLERRI